MINKAKQFFLLALFSSVAMFVMLDYEVGSFARNAIGISGWFVLIIAMIVLLDFLFEWLLYHSKNS
jgi:uncharacterized protein HemY